MSLSCRVFIFLEQNLHCNQYQVDKCIHSFIDFIQLAASNGDIAANYTIGTYLYMARGMHSYVRTWNDLEYSSKV